VRAALDNNILGRALPLSNGPARRLLNLLSQTPHEVIVSLPMLVTVSGSPGLRYGTAF